MDEKHLNLKFNDEDKGLAIGKSGERIKKAKMLCKRLFGTEEVRIV
jgi:transcription antitermination factor NusA-like protein